MNRVTVNSNQSVRTIGFTGLLGLLFIALKLTGVIDWSWWLVLLPIYAPLALVGIILLIVFILAVVNNETD